MEANFWRARWQEGQIGFHQEHVNDYLTLNWPALKLVPNSRVFVPLCGKSKDMVWLRSQGYEVLGVELSPLAVHAFFDENGHFPQPVVRGRFTCSVAGGYELLCGDFFDLTKSDCAGVSAVYDRASLIALPPTIRERYAQHLGELLAPGTVVLLITMEYPSLEMEGPPFPVHENEVRRLYQSAFDVRLVGTADVLAANPRFRDRGLTSLQEKIYLLTRF